MAWNMSAAKRRALVKLQLRDKNGRWIEMGGGVKWYSSRLKKEVTGTVVGSKGNNALVRLKKENPTHEPALVKVPARHIEVVDAKARLTAPGEKVSNADTPEFEKPEAVAKVPVDKASNAVAPTPSLESDSAADYTISETSDGNTYITRKDGAELYTSARALNIGDELISPEGTSATKPFSIGKGWTRKKAERLNTAGPTTGKVIDIAGDRYALVQLPDGITVDDPNNPGEQTDLVTVGLSNSVIKATPGLKAALGDKLKGETFTPRTDADDVEIDPADPDADSDHEGREVPEDGQTVSDPADVDLSDITDGEEEEKAAPIAEKAREIELPTEATGELNENGLTDEEQKLVKAYDRMADRANAKGDIENADTYAANANRLRKLGEDRRAGREEAPAPAQEPEKAPESAPEPEKASEVTPEADKPVETAPEAAKANVSLDALEQQAKADGDTVLYHGGLPEGTTLDGIDLNRNGSQQNKRGRSFGGFYLTDESSKDWSDKYAMERNGVMHGFAIDKNARIDDRGSEQIDRLSAESRVEAAKNFDVIKGKDLLGRTQYVILNKDVVKGVGETNLKGDKAPESAPETPEAPESAPEPETAPEAVTTVPANKLSGLPTDKLIEQYELAISSQKGRFSNTAPRQKRINTIVDMISERADNGDPVAEKWYTDAESAPAKPKSDAEKRYDELQKDVQSARDENGTILYDDPRRMAADSADQNARDSVNDGSVKEHSKEWYDIWNSTYGSALEENKANAPEATPEPESAPLTEGEQFELPLPGVKKLAKREDKSAQHVKTLDGLDEGDRVSVTNAHDETRTFQKHADGTWDELDPEDPTEDESPLREAIPASEIADIFKRKDLDVATVADREQAEQDERYKNTDEKGRDYFDRNPEPKRNPKLKDVPFEKGQTNAEREQAEANSADQPWSAEEIQGTMRDWFDFAQAVKNGDNRAIETMANNKRTGDEETDIIVNDKGQPVDITLTYNEYGDPVVRLSNFDDSKDIYGDFEIDASVMPKHLSTLIHESINSDDIAKAIEERNGSADRDLDAREAEAAEEEDVETEPEAAAEPEAPEADAVPEETTPAPVDPEGRIVRPDNWITYMSPYTSASQYDDFPAGSTITGYKGNSVGMSLVKNEDGTWDYTKSGSPTKTLSSAEVEATISPFTRNTMSGAFNVSGRDYTGDKGIDPWENKDAFEHTSVLDPGKHSNVFFSKELGRDLPVGSTAVAHFGKGARFGLSYEQKRSDGVEFTKITPTTWEGTGNDGKPFTITDSGFAKWSQDEAARFDVDKPDERPEEYKPDFSKEYGESPFGSGFRRLFSEDDDAIHDITSSKDGLYGVNFYLGDKVILTDGTRGTYAGASNGRGFKFKADDSKRKTPIEVNPTSVAEAWRPESFIKTSDPAKNVYGDDFGPVHFDVHKPAAGQFKIGDKVNFGTKKVPGTVMDIEKNGVRIRRDASKNARQTDWIDYTQINDVFRKGLPNEPFAGSQYPESKESDAPVAPEAPEVAETPDAPEVAETAPEAPEAAVEAPEADATPEAENWSKHVKTEDDGYIIRESEDYPEKLEIVTPDGVVSRRIDKTDPDLDKKVEDSVRQSRTAYESRTRAKTAADERRAEVAALEPFEPVDMVLPDSAFRTSDGIRVGDRLLTMSRPNGSEGVIQKTRSSLSRNETDKLSGKSALVVKSEPIMGQNKTSRGTVVGSRVEVLHSDGKLEKLDLYSNRGGSNDKNGVFLDTPEFRAENIDVASSTEDAPADTLNARGLTEAEEAEYEQHMIDADVEARAGDSDGVDEYRAKAEEILKRGEERTGTSREEDNKDLFKEEPADAPEAVSDPAPEAAPAAPEETPESGDPEVHPLDALGITRRTPEAVEGETYAPTQQQQDVIDAVLGGLDTKVQAMAGTGKTSTLVALSRRLTAEGKQAIYIAFNKTVQEEAEERMKGLKVEAKTGHGVAHTWARVNMPHLTARLGGKNPMEPIKFNKAGEATDWADRKPVTQSREIARILGIKNNEITEDSGAPLPTSTVVLAVKKTVGSFALSDKDDIRAEHIPESFEISEKSAPRIIELAKAYWDDLSSEEGVFRMEHDTYRKHWALSRPDLTDGTGGNTKGATVLYIDEAQDTPPVLAKVVADQNMQKVIVGDANQAIYAFAENIDYLSEADGDIELPLDKSWRFGPEVADAGNRMLWMLGSDARVIGGGGPSKIVNGMEDADAVLVRTNAGMIHAILEESERGRKVAAPAGTRGELIRMADTVAALMNGEVPENPHDDLIGFKNWDEVMSALDSGDRSVSKIISIFDETSPTQRGRIKDYAKFREDQMDRARKAIDSLVMHIPEFDNIKLVKEGNRTFLEGNGTLKGSKDAFAPYDFSVALGRTQKPWAATSGMNYIEKKKAWHEAAGLGTEGWRFDSRSKCWYTDSAEVADSILRYSGQGDVTISTAHKSKGLEWDRVRIGDDFFVPYEDAKTGAMVFPEDDEYKLGYVALTRAAKELDPGVLGWVYDHTPADITPKGKKSEDTAPAPEQIAEEVAPSNVPDEVADLETDVPEEVAPEEAPVVESTPDAAPEVSTPSKYNSDGLTPTEQARVDELGKQISDAYKNKSDVDLNELENEYNDILEVGDRRMAGEDLPEYEKSAAPAVEEVAPEAPAPSTAPARAPSPMLDEEGLTPQERRRADELERWINDVYRGKGQGNVEKMENELFDLLGRGERRLNPTEESTPAPVQETATPAPEEAVAKPTTPKGRKPRTTYDGVPVLDANGTQIQIGDTVGHPRFGPIQVTGHLTASGRVTFIDPVTNKEASVKGANVSIMEPDVAADVTTIVGQPGERFTDPATGKKAFYNGEGDPIVTGQRVVDKKGRTGTVKGVYTGADGLASVPVQWDDEPVKKTLPRVKGILLTLEGGNGDTGGNGGNGGGGDSAPDAPEAPQVPEPLAPPEATPAPEETPEPVAPAPTAPPEPRLDPEIEKIKAEIAEAKRKEDRLYEMVDEAEAMPIGTTITKGPVVFTKTQDDQGAPYWRQTTTTPGGKVVYDLGDFDMASTVLHLLGEESFDAVFPVAEPDGFHPGLVDGTFMPSQTGSTSGLRKTGPDSWEMVKDGEGTGKFVTDDYANMLFDLNSPELEKPAPVKPATVRDSVENYDAAAKAQSVVSTYDPSVNGASPLTAAGIRRYEEMSESVLRDDWKLKTSVYTEDADGNPITHGVKVWNKKTGKYVGIVSYVEDGANGKKVRIPNEVNKMNSSGTALNYRSLSGASLTTVSPRPWDSSTDLDFSDVSSHAEINDRLTQSYPSVHFMISDDLDLDVAKNYGNLVSKLFNKFPMVQHSMNIVQSEPRGDNSLASVNSPWEYTAVFPDQTLNLNPIIRAETGEFVHKSTTMDDIIKANRTNSDNGFFNNVPEGRELEYTLTHEMGHALDGLTGWMDSGTVYAMLDEFLKGEEPDGTYNASQTLLERIELSGYSLGIFGSSVDPAELIAEAFADVELNGADAKPLSKFIHQQLMNRLEGLQL